VYVCIQRITATVDQVRYKKDLFSIQVICVLLITHVPYRYVRILQ